MNLTADNRCERRRGVLFPNGLELGDDRVPEGDS
jgi:hypothetical protein